MPVSSINLHPDRPALDGRNLEPLVELYLADVARHCTAGTTESYRSFLQRFVLWWREHAPKCDWLLDAIQLAEFSRHLATCRTAAEQPLTHSYRLQILAKVRQLFAWAYRLRYVSVDLSHCVPTLRGSGPIQPPVSLSTLAALLDTARLSRYGLRNQAIIATLAGTGIRCHECTALSVSDVTMRSDLSGILRLRVAKLSKPRLAAFDAATGEYLNCYLHSLDALPLAPLFPSQTGGHLAPGSLYSMLRIVAQKAGVADQIRGPHDLRRLFATHWARERPGEGYGALLQRQLGHSSYSMTSQYLLQQIEDVADVLREEGVSPVAAVSRAQPKYT